MARTVKASVSLDRRLFERVEALAETLHISRSRMMAQALEEFLRRYENRQMLDRLNAVYAEPEDDIERRMREGMGRLQHDVVKGEW
ncbi:MAG: ribbon-helix-helix protein, CopG family [bacterium]|nr:ribbon-helix-helix protein, CopG family [bacterium]